MNADRKPSRFRYSLRSFLIATTVVTVAVYHWNVSRRLREAEMTVAKLRDETGRLNIEDNSLVNVIAVESGESNVWRWRMFVPKGHKYMWHVASERIPYGKIPDRAGSSGISNARYWERDNEVLVTARLTELADGNYSLSVSSRIGNSDDQMAGASIVFPSDHLAWTQEHPSQQVDIAGRASQATFDPSQPFMLFSKRPMAVLPNGDTDFDFGLTHGLAIWLEPK
ncbi:hypothetical protein [Rhodopirellula sallentina]|uniref:hypothetical protein n=1 Tax=Rhodopirellula sallentina TaxID=1263869 RepID=UPI0005C7B881|nr:hypothetical protein [Rhodopirellula sallentina]